MSYNKYRVYQAHTVGLRASRGGQDKPEEGGKRGDRRRRDVCGSCRTSV